MAKRVIHEDHISHDRWMVSYADFLTLLLAFFVVMYSVSQLDEAKYRVLSDTLTEAFNVPEQSLDPIQVGERVRAVNPGIVEDQTQSPEQKPESGRVEEQGEKATTSEPQLPEEFRKISQQVQQEFAELMKQDLVSVQGNEEWLEIELKSSLLFASGEAEASDAAVPIMTAMAGIVKGSQLPIRVEGFTDDQPIASAQFPSNWELSAARAGSIVKLLVEEGVDATRLAAIGYGEFQPVAPNTDEIGRAANRRVVLMISRNASLRPAIARRETIAPATLVPAADAAAPQPPAPDAAVAPTAAQPLDGVAAEAPDAAESASAPAAAPTGEAGPDAVAPPTNVVRIELEGGGVLFTNDPARAAGATPPATESSPPP